MMVMLSLVDTVDAVATVDTAVDAVDAVDTAVDAVKTIDSIIVDDVAIV
jgi:hypothetical protein